jgi:transketolase
VSVPWELGFEAPAPAAPLVVGQGTVARPGSDAWLLCTGPVLASQAVAACSSLRADGVDCGLILLPWLRDVDGAWLSSVVGAAPLLCLDNHLADCGQGSALLCALNAVGHRGRVGVHGIEGVPVCGTNDEVLAHHRLDAAGIVAALRALLP